jgi:hypothetical protein
MCAPSSPRGNEIAERSGAMTRHSETWLQIRRNQHSIMQHRQGALIIDETSQRVVRGPLGKDC